MKYFIDTEFLEGTQKTLFGYGNPTIDLISIAITAEDGREYYSISKDFNLKEAWNIFQSWEIPELAGDKRNFWIRDNVLKPIYNDLHNMVGTYGKTYHWSLFEPFSYKSLKTLIGWYGKNNKQIANEIKYFVNPSKEEVRNISFTEYQEKYGKKEFYGYYSDYDWVVFCWLFGRMIDLPYGFPKYCIDLKQILDEKIMTTNCFELFAKSGCSLPPKKKEEDYSFDEKLEIVKNSPNYPKQIDEHNALGDAKWNKELFLFLKGL